MPSRSSERAHRATTLAALAGACLLTGCISMDVPEDFVVLHRGPSEFKAVSSDEAKLWVRTFSEPHPGDLRFWSEVVLNDFVENRGYTLLEPASSVRDGDEHEGTAHVFEVTVNGEAQRYLVCIFWMEGWFVFRNDICVAEFVAPKAVFETRIAAVRESIGTLSP